MLFFRSAFICEGIQRKETVFRNSRFPSNINLTKCSTLALSTPCTVTDEKIWTEAHEIAADGQPDTYFWLSQGTINNNR
jgi:hypothetical protein